MKIVLVLVLVLVLGACGGSAPPASSPSSTASGTAQPTQQLPPELPPLLIEYVVIQRRWVEKLAPAPAADVKAWSEAPENAAAVGGTFRHILVKSSGPGPEKAADSRAKAQAILKRLAKGEDFAKLARQVSDDAATKDAGGEASADKVKDLPPEVQAAFAALAPGKTAPDPILASDGAHIVRKERPSEDEVERAYRRAKAPELTQRLATELAGRLKGDASSRTAIADAVDAVLGERGVSDAARPTAHAVPRDNVEHVRLPAAAKAALVTFARSAHPGDVLPSPAVDGETTVVARASAPR